MLTVFSLFFISTYLFSNSLVIGVEQFRRGRSGFNYTAKSSLQFSQFNKTLVKKIKETQRETAESRLDKVINEGKARFKTRKPTQVDEYERLLEKLRREMNQSISYQVH